MPARQLHVHGMKSKSDTRTFDVELLALAEDELSDAYDWYEEQQESLGDKLYYEVNYFLNLLELNPYQFQVRYADDLRAASLNKFPYLIIFWIDEPNYIIYVVSIFHTSRNPQF